MMTQSRTTAHLSSYAGRLIPRGDKLYVVRWHRPDGRDIAHRYYRRRADAERRVVALAERGITAGLFETRTQWKAAAR